MLDYNPIFVTTFDNMRYWADLFSKDAGINALVVIGSPGTSKSQTFKRRLGEDNVIEGKLTPILMYQRLFELKDQPVCFDDVDSLLRTPDCVNLLKLILNTDVKKTIQWNTASTILSNGNIPTRFETTSRVVIIANSMARIEKNLAAVLDRVFVVEFTPSAQEIHAEVAKWFVEQEVYQFIGDYVASISQPSMRWYVKARELKLAGGDWKSWLLAAWALDPKDEMVMGILRDGRLKTEKQRVARFAELGGGSRDTYMRHQRKVRQQYPAMRQQPRATSIQPKLVGPGAYHANGNTSIPVPGSAVLPEIDSSMMATVPAMVATEMEMVPVQDGDSRGGTHDK